MEQTELTIRLPRDLVERAKRYAQENDTSLTRLVSVYLRQLTVSRDPLADTPIVRRLSGILSRDSSVKGYYQYLEEKNDDWTPSKA